MAKYFVDITTEIYCSSTGHYNGKVIIRSDSSRDVRNVDLHGLRIMYKHKPFTYNGYPKYVSQIIARGFKQAWDSNQLRVYEYTRDETRRYENLRYHDPHILQRLINHNYNEWCS